MRVVLTTVAARTHLYSMVPLAWALKAAGHEVRVAVQPSLVPHVTAAGLAAVPVGDDVHIELPSPRQSDHLPFGTMDFAQFNHEDVATVDLIGMFTVMVPTYLAVTNDSQLRGLVDFARSWRPDLVIWEPMTWSGAIAARACGARHARLQWGPDVLGDAMTRLDHRLEQLPAPHREDPLREWFSWSADRVGVETVPEDVYGEWTIEVEPPPFRLTTGLDTMEAGYVPYNGAAEVPRWLDNAGAVPLVCITLGISSRVGDSRDAVDLVALTRSLGSMPIEFVVTMGAEQQTALGPPPHNVRVVDYVALDLLLPSCAAIVHHGGAGTWSTALRHAVPQVILGHTWDAPLKAGWLEAAGAGLALDPGVSHREVLLAIERVLGGEQFAEKAGEFAVMARDMPTPADAVSELERRLAEPRCSRGNDGQPSFREQADDGSHGTPLTPRPDGRRRRRV